MLNVSISNISLAYRAMGEGAAPGQGSSAGGSGPAPLLNRESDRLFLSDTARGLLQRGSDEAPEAAGTGMTAAQTEQSYQETVALKELQARDKEVRAHEQAHLAAAGQYVRGGASFAYQSGPDGQKYAVGGEVPIDIGRERTPEETIAKMQVVKRAALAPASPSAADRQIAAQASMRLAEAQRELQQQAAAETGEAGPAGHNSFGTPTPAAGDPAVPGAPAVADTRALMIEAYRAIDDLL